MSAFNDRVIAEFRANDGRVGGWGDRLVLVHHRGARSGRKYINPAMSLRDGQDWLVVGSAMGAPEDPHWAVNLRAHPDVEIEAAVGGRLETVQVIATELAGAERDRGWRLVTAAVPSFAAYQGRTSRDLPVIRLRRRTAIMAPDDPDRSLAVRNAETDPSLPHLGVVGDTYTVLLTGADTDDRYGLIDMLVPPAGGPPLHRHDFEEMFHILEGEIEFTFRGEKLTARAGDTVNIPARAPHHFTNVSDRNARMLTMVTPAGIEEFFGIWGEPLPERTSAPDPSQTLERLQTGAALSARYRIENLV
jgi:deazaflavin-dependent oxidoreductase (nitroreductase family)